METRLHGAELETDGYDDARVKRDSTSHTVIRTPRRGHRNVPSASSADLINALNGRRFPTFPPLLLSRPDS